MEFFSKANKRMVDTKTLEKQQKSRDKPLKEVEKTTKGDCQIVYGDSDSIIFTVTEKPRQRPSDLSNWVKYKPSSKY